MKTTLLQLVSILCMLFLVTAPLMALEQGSVDGSPGTSLTSSQGNSLKDDSLEQQLLEMLVKNTIIIFDHPAAQEMLSGFSELIKDEYTYQFIIQKIDKFILTNELDDYEDQAEALKDALTEMRELYIRSEQETLKKYNEMKQQQQEREKQRELKANHVIEV